MKKSKKEKDDEEKIINDFINENIDISDYLKEQPPITKTDFSKNLDYEQTEFKPTLFRYIRLMDKENKDKDGNVIVPEYQYGEFSSISYSYQNREQEAQGPETIRRLQKTKLNSNSYPFDELVPSNDKRKGLEKKTDQNSKDNNSKSSKKDKNKKVLNLSQIRHFHVQNFTIITLCLIINAFSCIIYYTSDWPDLIKRLPNQINLSKIIINDSFIFTGDKLFLQKTSARNLENDDHHVILNNVNYGNIIINASNPDTRVKCDIVQSKGNSITIGLINFTLIDDTVQMSISKNHDIISFNMNIDNIGLLDLTNATSIFGNKTDQTSEAQLLETPSISDIKREKNKKTLLKRSVNSESIPIFYDFNFNEVFIKKHFEIKKGTFYVLLFENDTLSFVHVNNKKRPKINSDKIENDNFIINWSALISEDVKDADAIINEKSMNINKKEIKFIYIKKDEFHLHIGKFYLNGQKISKILDFDLPKINLSRIYNNNQNEQINIKLSTDSKGFPIITLNDDIIINCRHPLCAYEKFN